MQTSTFNDIPVYNKFISILTDDKAKKINNEIEVKGHQNTVISSIFFKHLQNDVLNIENFQKEIANDNRIDKGLKEKTFKALKDSQMDLFKEKVGGPDHKQGQQTVLLAELFNDYLRGMIDKDTLYKNIDTSNVSGPAKSNAKKYLQSIGIREEKSTTTTSQVIAFKLTPKEVLSQYQNLKCLRQDTSFQIQKDVGGAVNVGYSTIQKNPQAKIGVMIAANSGLPGGALGQSGHKITSKDLSMTTQEESIWANAALTSSQDGHITPEQFHHQTIEGKWGLLDTKGTMTKQGIDFTTTTNAVDYNQVYLLKGCHLSKINTNTAKEKDILKNAKYEVVFAFADSVNANKEIGTPQGTMQRTLNKQAINNYDFFRECIKNKLRSALDGMASQGVTHPLVARLSCGIYAGIHKDRITNDFNNLLQEILEESVGPNGEKRAQYFVDIIIPDIQKS